MCVLGFEQAIGYMVGDVRPDKDGVHTAAVVAEMANQLYGAQHTTLGAHLDALYSHYGYMAARDSYFFCYDPKRMFAIFEEMKTGLLELLVFYFFANAALRSGRNVS